MAQTYPETILLEVDLILTAQNFNCLSKIFTDKHNYKANNESATFISEQRQMPQ